MATKSVIWFIFMAVIKFYFSKQLVLWKKSGTLKLSWFTNTTTKSIHIFKQNMLAQHVVSPCTQQPDQFTPPDNLRRNQLRDGGRHYSLAHYPVIWEVCWSSGSRADAADRHCYMRAGNKTRLLRRCFLSPAEIKILIGNRSAYYSQR